MSKAKHSGMPLFIGRPVQACLNRVRVSPQKINLLAQMIRGKKVPQALAELEFSRKRIAHEVRKTLQSAIANAENNHELDVDFLFVEKAFVGKSLVLKRFQARGRGKSSRIRKPFSNLTIIVRQATMPESINEAEKSAS